MFLAHVCNACLSLCKVPTLEHFYTLFRGVKDPFVGAKYNVATHNAASFISYCPTNPTHDAYFIVN